MILSSSVCLFLFFCCLGPGASSVVSRATWTQSKRRRGEGERSLRRWVSHGQRSRTKRRGRGRSRETQSRAVYPPAAAPPSRGLLAAATQVFTRCHRRRTA